MPRQKQPTSLLKSCLNCIATNMDDFFCAKYVTKRPVTPTQDTNEGDVKYETIVHPNVTEGPFNFLPTLLKEQLIDWLIKEDKIKEHSRKLLLLGCTTHNRDWLREKIDTSHCLAQFRQENLKYLNISGCEIEEETLCKLTENIPNITRLKLDFIDTCTDKVLFSLAKNCSKLEKLGLYYCRNITDDGLVSLHSLQLTELDISTSGITRKGAQWALINFTQLVELIHQDLHKVFAVESLRKMIQDEDKTFNIRSLQIWDFELPFNYQDLAQILVKGCPKINKLEIIALDVSHDMMNICANFSNLESFKGSNYYSENYLPSFLSKRGTQLKSIHFAGNLTHFESIANFCSNLETLTFRVEVNDIYPDSWLPQNTFSQLRVLDMSGDWEFILPALFNCHRIETLKLSYCGDTLTDRDLKTVLKRNPMKSLKSLLIRRSCKLTIAIIHRFLEQADNLTEIDIEFCRKIKLSDICNLRKFTKEENLDVEINYQDF